LRCQPAFGSQSRDTLCKEVDFFAQGEKAEKRGQKTVEMRIFWYEKREFWTKKVSAKKSASLHSRRVWPSKRPSYPFCIIGLFFYDLNKSPLKTRETPAERSAKIPLPGVGRIALRSGFVPNNEIYFSN
jgi:hypothetical protein